MKKTVSTSSLFSWVILEIENSVVASGTLPLSLRRGVKGQGGAEVQEYSLCSRRNCYQTVALPLMNHMTLDKL